MWPRLSPQKSTVPAGLSSSRKIDLWFHATERAHFSAFEKLRCSLLLDRPDLKCLVSAGSGLKRPDWLLENVHWYGFEADRAAEAADFFQSYEPALCLWAGGELMPNLLTEAAKRDVPLYLIDAVAEGFVGPRWRRGRRRVLNHFSLCLARDQAAASTLRRLGATCDVKVTGPLQQGAPVAPCDEESLDELRAAIGSRPVWTAARVRVSELDVVLSAHMQASRIAHRLLLLLVPDCVKEAGAFEEKLEEMGLKTAHWPDLALLEGEAAQVILAEDDEELGLWLRAAPLCFLGCSLGAAQHGISPYPAASLGAAILYGPNIGGHLEAYSRFAQAGAARIVRDTQTLTAAIAQLTAPDKAARMAMAGWDLATAGAEVTDSLTEMVHDALDELGVM